MSYKTLILYFVVLVHLQANAQNRKDFWALGDSILVRMGTDGFEFSRTIPFYGYQGVTSISDTLGNLLYYANSTTAFNRFDDTLQNGQDLTEGFPNMVQGCITIPVPGTTDRYYLFTLEHNGGARNSLLVSGIDMGLDGGRGGVMPGLKAKLLVNNIGEMLHAVRHGNGQDWWVFVCPLKPDSTSRSQGIVRFQVTEDSIIGPVFQDVGKSNGAFGEMVISPDGEQLAICSYTTSLIQIFRLDRCSGLLSEGMAIYDKLGGESYIGIAFGPQSRVLYGVRADPRVINQFFPNGKGYDQNEIVRYGTKANHFLGPPELGPDGKIYVASFSIGVEPDTTTYYLGVVREPVMEGLYCAFDTFGVWLGGIHNESTAIPNQPNYELGILEGSPCDPSVSSMSTLIGTSETWSVFPNPLQDRVCLESNNGSHPDKISLFDVAGRLVWEEETFDSFGGATYCYDVPPSLAPGSYSLRIQWGKGAYRRHVEVTGR